MILFPKQLRSMRTGEWFDLAVDVYCPECGYQLCDGAFLDRIPNPDSWDATARARCENCGRRFRVQAVIERPDQPTRTFEHCGTSWYGSMRRR